MAYFVHCYQWEDASSLRKAEEIFPRLLLLLKEKYSANWMYERKENSFLLKEEKENLKEDFVVTTLVNSLPLRGDNILIPNDLEELEERVRAHLFSSLRTKIVFETVSSPEEAKGDLLLDASFSLHPYEDDSFSSLAAFLNEYFTKKRLVTPAIYVSFLSFSPFVFSSLFPRLKEYFSYRFQVEIKNKERAK